MISQQSSARSSGTPKSGLPVTPPLRHGGPVSTIWSARMADAPSPPARTARARIWHGSGARIQPALAHPAGTRVFAATFSPDGARIATIGSDNEVRLWDSASGQLQAELIGHVRGVAEAVFLPDGALLLTYPSIVRSDSDVASGRARCPAPRARRPGQPRRVQCRRRRVVTASGAHARVWDVPDGRSLVPPVRAPGRCAVCDVQPRWQLPARRWPRDPIWDTALDARTLAAWQRIARDNSFPPIGDARYPDRVGDR